MNPNLPSHPSDDPAADLHTSDLTVANQYGDVAAVYDALMRGVPHSLWLSRIERGVRERNKRLRSALDVACGTGIATFLLAERGYAPVLGVDISPAMVGIARTKALNHRKGSEVQFLVQDASELDLGGQRFDLVISLFDSLNYILEPEKLQRAFVRIFEATESGGVFAFDLNSMYALAQHFFTQTCEFGPVRHVWESHWDRESRICRVEMAFWIDDDETGETREFHETHIQRAYTTPEITEYLTNAGFTAINAYGNYGGRPPIAKSDRLLFICEKP